MRPIPTAELRERLRRKFDRFKFHVQAEMLCQSKTVKCRVTDISREGVYIEVAHPPAEGTRFTLRLALNAPLRLEGIVRRVVPGAGIGATFQVSEKQRKRFEALLLALALEADPTAIGATFPPAVRARELVMAASQSL